MLVDTHIETYIRSKKATGSEYTQGFLMLERTEIPGIAAWGARRRVFAVAFGQNKSPDILSGRCGAGNGTRTCDLLITNQLLYRLSYSSGVRCFSNADMNMD